MYLRYPGYLVVGITSSAAKIPVKLIRKMIWCPMEYLSEVVSVVFFERLDSSGVPISGNELAHFSDES